MNAPATHDAELLHMVTQLCGIARAMTGGWDYLNQVAVPPPSFQDVASRMSSLSCACGIVEEMLKERSK